MPDVVLMEPCFLGKVPTTLSPGKGARGGVGITDLVVLPEKWTGSWWTIKALEEGMSRHR